MSQTNSVKQFERASQISMLRFFRYSMNFMLCNQLDNKLIKFSLCKSQKDLIKISAWQASLNH